LIITYTANEKNGSLDDVKKALDKENIKYEITTDAPVNPEIKEMQKFGDMASDIGADMIIGIGGGSALDTAKTAAVLAVNKMPLEDLYKNTFSNMPLPVIAVPTTAGTGSEVTPYAVLSIKEKNTKKSFGNEDMMSPVYAFLDASYTETMPPQVAADSAVDALSHGVEGYLSAKGNWVSDMLGITIFNNFRECTKSLKKRAFSCEDREKLLFNSTLSGIMINHMRTLAVHAMGYPLSINRHLSHGCSCGVLLGAFLKYVYPACAEKADKMYEALGVKNTEEFSGLISSILQYRDNYTLEELERYTDESIDAAAAKPNPKPVDRTAVLSIYKRSLM
jgi:alcohol dehydrogenase class IV